jgi:hypothetical protein
MAEFPLGELLMGIAQIAIAFVGFAAIVEVVRERTQQERSQFEHFLARTMIEFGFSALFLALLPLLIIRFYSDESPSLWQALAGLITIVMATHVLVYSRRRQRDRNKIFLMPIVYRAWMLASVAVVAALIAGILGVLPPEAAYVLAPTWFLVSGSYGKWIVTMIVKGIYKCREEAAPPWPPLNRALNPFLCLRWIMKIHWA